MCKHTRTWKHILLLEPAAIVQRQLTHTLEQMGESCLVFQRAAALLHYLKADPGPAVVVADCFLPDMDLFAFLQKYQALCGQSQGHRLIITCTESYPPRQMRPQILSNGADYYMIKPYTAEELLCNVRRLYAPVWLPTTLNVHPAIVEYCKRLGLSSDEMSFWYIASAVQYGLDSRSPLYLKPLYIELGQTFGLTPQGVESGLRRAGKNLTDLGVFNTRPSPKQLVTALVSAFLREKQESQDDDAYALPR